MPNMERVVLLLLLTSGLADSSEWTYEDIEAWLQLPGNNCDGKRQSPIDIRHTTGRHFRRLDLSSLSKSSNVQMFNNGHTVQIELPQKKYFAKGGGLHGKYFFEQIHFHWGSSKKQGSEHQVRGRQFPLEMHMVSFKAAYSSLENALSKPHDGIAVFAVLFKQHSHYKNLALNRFVKRIAKLARKKAESDSDISPRVRLPHFVPASLIAGVDTRKYYRYSGSLTTPNCTENVIWTVFRQVIRVGERQMRSFRKVKLPNGRMMSNNFRPVQPLNGRRVYRSW